ncbi:hypothetical protein [Streptomyces hoynatensis]|uniref:Uncharacterized protein n=1 Tax=Streptomyces hoynatensis TaxID=1141874 RepID=A0A3A9YHR0_9ACTN|nr:hypothetical protein [Streptomyces hoynatensis]RKN36685.1 hypothetical protein D7294_29860 [Streptomyces hoynatensis]
MIIRPLADGVAPAAVGQAARDGGLPVVDETVDVPRVNRERDQHGDGVEGPRTSWSSSAAKPSIPIRSSWVAVS